MHADKMHIALAAVATTMALVGQTCMGTAVKAVPPQVAQLPLSSGAQVPLSAARPASLSSGYEPLEEGVGHFSEWSKTIKRMFIDDVRDGKASEWTIVMGNEGGDLDSMTAALTWSYHVSHMAGANKTGDSDNGDSPAPAAKAIALLQTPRDALDLRPENRLALHNVQMSPGHRDLLTISELPLPAEELAAQVHGIVLVDHPEPLSVWKKARIVSLFDHHKDRGVAPDAKPRIFEGTASCTTLVAREMLDALESLPKEYHMPHEVVELILDAIALDSDGLNKATPEDVFVSRRLLKRSNWREEKLLSVMQRLDKEMSTAKKDLDKLDVRDLLRRDWKGDLIETKSSKFPAVHLGFASIPISLDDQIERTLHEQVQSWFDIEQQWAEEIGADISLSLHSYKVKLRKDKANVAHEGEDDEDEDKDDNRGKDLSVGVDASTSDESANLPVHALKKRKVREICLVVRASERLDEEAADRIFAKLKHAIGDSPFLDAEPWDKVDQLRGRQMVWVHHQPNGGRKLIRPIVEYAVQTWDGA